MNYNIISIIKLTIEAIAFGGTVARYVSFAGALAVVKRQGECDLVWGKQEQNLLIARQPANERGVC